MSPAPSRLPPAAARSASVRSELGAALASCRGAFIAIGLVSGLSNILMLTGAMFMLEIYDRVLPSRSVPTLVAIAILAAALFAAHGILDLIPGPVCLPIRRPLDETSTATAVSAISRL